MQPTTIVETAPPPVRCTAVALGYNISLGVIGGLTPLVATWLVNRTGEESAGVHDHGRGRRYLHDAAVVSRDLSHPVHRRQFRRGRGLRVTRAAAEGARSVHAVKAARRLRAA